MFPRKFILFLLELWGEGWGGVTAPRGSIVPEFTMICSFLFLYRGAAPAPPTTSKAVVENGRKPGKHTDENGVVNLLGKSKQHTVRYG